MKKYVILCFLILNPLYLFAQNNLYRAVYNGDINYIRLYINNFNNSSQEHEYFSNNIDLRLLRNTIYAMHGYRFRSRDLQEHFNKFSWYNGTKDTVENELNEKERRLIRVILAMEQVNPPSPNDIIGFWTIAVPASVEYIGFMDLQINSDGTIGGFLNGLWSLEGTTFNTRRVNTDYIGLPPGLGQLGTVENLRIIVFELNGRLYQTCDFFGAYPDSRSSSRHWYRRNDLRSLIQAWGWRESDYIYPF
ncbi:MAG: YARHG domain-containing protein [Treponema sp.]|jgi:hypothetical protein|nr:YARHG domain-containing protein [Treponema sp.]